MVIADTSIWIDYFNGLINRETNTLDQLIIDGNVAMGDLILLEILQGFRDDGDYARAKSSLTNLDQFDMFTQGMAVKCADNYRALRKKGITIRKTSDVIIASFCIENKLPLLFSDKDFLPFVKHLGLVSVL